MWAQPLAHSQPSLLPLAVQVGESLPFSGARNAAPYVCSQLGNEMEGSAADTAAGWL